ncbi:MAG TPA: hypothetical protein PLK63_11580 [Catalimonadaceae bacterium]|nr:hypothetical protein [Catalimonadaceae bacterium]
MKLKLLIILILALPCKSYSQLPSEANNFLYAKEFSKEIALFNTKSFLFRDVLGISSDIVQFEVIPLAASNSGELTTLLYRCESKNKEGLVLGFYGNYWNKFGAVYQGFSFKNLEKEKAIEFLNRIQSAMDDNEKFLFQEADNNNIYFRYDDIDVLICYSYQNYIIRLFWNGFDSTWERTAFNRSKRRFERKMK